jgi:type II secretory pathway predicted ATPase ExeA
MYQQFFGLRELPFDLSPDPRYLHLTRRHREALANLEYGITARKTLTVLVGEAGTGKTTVVRAALQSDACRAVRTLYLSNPALTRNEFLDFLAAGFSLGLEAAESKAVLLQRLEEELLERRRLRVITALVIDEAQSMPIELLEEVRLLANIETSSEKLLPLVLIGQPELADRLNEPELRQLKQRVALRCMLGRLSREETDAYITGRLNVAGGGGRKLFADDAIDLVHQYSAGIPRTISVICDNALVSAFALQQKRVSASMVREVCDDFDLAPSVHGLPNRADHEPEAAASEEPEPQQRLAVAGRRRRFSFF